MYFVNTQSSSTHYFSGSMSGYYGATTTTKNNGVDVYFEKVHLVKIYISLTQVLKTTLKLH